MLVSFILISSGKVSTSLNNFAIDSHDRVYVGKKYLIEVYENGDLVNTINPLTSRTYAFTILDDDVILLSTSSVEYLMDMDGHVISSREDVGTSTYNKIKNNKEFIAKSGEVYELKNHFGRYSIVSDENIIYCMPTFDYIIKFLYNLAYTVFLICVVVVICWTRLKSQSVKDWTNQTIRGRFSAKTGDGSSVSYKSNN